MQLRAKETLKSNRTGLITNPPSIRGVSISDLTTSHVEKLVSPRGEGGDLPPSVENENKVPLSPSTCKGGPLEPMDAIGESQKTFTSDLIMTV